jgi:hypothetical protein
MSPKACKISLISFKQELWETNLGDCVDLAADCQDALNCTASVVANGASSSRHATDQGHVLTTFTNDSGRFSTGDDGANVQPAAFVLAVLARGGTAIKACARVARNWHLGNSGGRIRYNGVAVVVCGAVMVWFDLNFSLDSVVRCCDGARNCSFSGSRDFVRDDLVECWSLRVGLVARPIWRRWLLQWTLLGWNGSGRW